MWLVIGGMILKEWEEQAKKEYDLIAEAVGEILDMSYTAFKVTDLKSARKTEP